MKISKKYVCICDRGQPQLAAVILSYFGEKDSYIPLFEFPFVSAPKGDYDPNAMDEHSMSRTRAEEISLFINNILARMGGCEHIIYAGLNEDQRSYLGKWNKVNQIWIDSIDEVDFFLSPIAGKDEAERIYCRPSQTVEGLFTALSKGAILQFREDAEDIELEYKGTGGLIVTEDVTAVCTLTAALYAFASGSDLKVVAPLTKEDKATVFESIKGWRDGDKNAYAFLEEQVWLRMMDIEIERYAHATFFTTALPYSLVLENVIPFSYVHLNMWADRFVMNCLLFDQQQSFGSAVVFSPEFLPDEETDLVIKILEKYGYYVKGLIGKDANVENLSMNLREFPYDIFHICSHGGEIKGHRIGINFKDEEGQDHRIEYESVVSLSPSSQRPGKFAVAEKFFPKVLDGLRWGSTEIKAKRYPQSLFAHAHNVIRNAKSKDKEILERDIVVTNSTSISCVDAIFQALMQPVASHTSPVVFNNTCWSWYHIAEAFIYGGVRGYIGCLWDVDNDAAVRFSTTFYEHVFDGTVMDAFHKANQSIKGSPSENIYVYWGLAFTSLRATEIKTAKHRIKEQLLNSFFAYEHNYKQTNSKVVREGIEDIFKFIEHEIRTRFKDEWIEGEKKKRAILDKEHPHWSEKYRSKNDD